MRARSLEVLYEITSERQEIEAGRNGGMRRRLEVVRQKGAGRQMNMLRELIFRRLLLRSA
jgi:hypothetical protein